MKLFVKVLLLIIISFAISMMTFNSLLAEEEKIPSPDDFIAVEVMPEMIYEEPPVYPEDAIKESKEGVVWIKAFVSKEGDVLKSIIGKSSGVKELDESALAASVKNKFKPAIQNGNPIGVWVTYKVDFVTTEKVELKMPDLDVPEKQEVDIMPEMVYEEKPIYPKEAVKDNVEGDVWVKSLIGEDGLVVKTEIHKSSGNELLDKSALKSAKGCKFTPAIKDDKPINAWVTYKVGFVVSEENCE